MDRNNKIEAISPFTKRLTPGSTHSDVAQSHYENAQHEHARAQAAREEFMNAKGWRNHNKRARLWKYMKEHQKAAIQHSNSAQYHAKKALQLGEEDIPSSGSRLKDWFARRKVRKQENNPEHENHEHENHFEHENHHEPDYSDNLHHINQEHHEENHDEIPHENSIKYHSDALDHHDERAAFHEAHAKKAKQEMSLHKEGSPKHKAAKDVFDEHMLKMRQHNEAADKSSENIKKLKNNITPHFEHHIQNNNLSEENKKHFDKDAKGEYPDDEYLDHMSHLHDGAANLLSTHPKFNSDDQIKKDHAIHKQSAKLFSKLSSKNKKTNEAISSKKPDVEDHHNKFFATLTPEQRDGYAESHDNDLAKAHNAHKVFPNSNHADMENYHSTMAKHHLDSANHHEHDANEETSNLPQANELNSEKANKAITALHMHTLNKHIAMHNGDAKSHNHYSNKANEAFEEARKAGVPENILEGQRKGAEKIAMHRVAAQAKRTKALNDLGNSAWHKAKHNNLNANPTKPKPIALKQEKPTNFPKNTLKPIKPTPKPVKSPNAQQVKKEIKVQKPPKFSKVPSAIRNVEKAPNINKVEPSKIKVKPKPPKVVL